MHIDVFSSVILNITSSFFMGLSLFIVARGYLGEIKGSKRFGGGLLIMCLGWLLQASSKVFPNITILAPFGTAAIMLTMAFYCHAVVEFKEIKFPVQWLYHLVLLTLVLLFFFDVIVKNVSARIVIVAFSAFLFASITSYVLLAKRLYTGAKIPASHKVTGYMFVLCAIILLGRVVYFSVFPIDSLFAVNWMQDLSYIVFHLVINVTSFSFLLMCSEKYAHMQKQAEINLQASENRFRDLFNNAPLPYQSLDIHGNFLDVNQAWLNLVGCERSEVIGNFFGNFMDESSKKLLADSFNQFQQQGFITSPVFELMSRNTGEIRLIVVHGQIARDEKGVFQRTHCILVDITEQYLAEQQLKENEARFRYIIDICPAPMALSDNENVLFVNQDFVDCFGYNLIDIPKISDWWQKAYPDEAYRAAIKQCWLENLEQAKQQNTAALPMEAIVECKNGMQKNITVSASLITQFTTLQKDGLNVVVFHDVTERKAQELAMQQAKQAAENLATSKAEFLANMSHEIRTPMNAIIGFSELALDEKLSEDTRLYVENIHTASKSLLGILNDILDLSKTEAGKLEIELVEFNVNEMLNELHNLFHLSAKKKHLAFSFDIDSAIPAMLIGDGLRIRQVLTNLLGNALKFTKTGSVKLNLQLLEFSPPQATIRFSVLDTGIGISREFQEKLFTPFTQEDSSTSRHFGGTGLGLTISQKLLNLMQSTLKVESEAGQGATFYFDLVFIVPLHQQRIEPIYDESKAGGLSSKMSVYNKKLANSKNLLTKGGLSYAKILLAEDDFINQELTTRFLKLAGLNVDVASDGLEVLEKLKTNTYDAILMDVNMPNMCGLAATKEIRKQEKYRNLPIIALTAGVTHEEQHVCLENGMSDFVEKPINPEKLVQMLVRYLE